MKTYIKFTIMMVATVFLIGCNSPEKADYKPNIIFIMADDLGYGDLGCFGQEIIKTPNLDRMATEGIMFTQHYAGNTVCAPSRCSLMTGLHMGHAEVRGNKQAKPEPSGQQPLSNRAITVAKLLKDAGYKTAMIGKWGLGNAGSSGEPTNQGFDYYYGYLDQVLAHNYYPESLIRNGKEETLRNEVKYLSKEMWHKGFGSYSTKKVDYSHDLFTEDALHFIEGNKKNPFFLYLPYTIPHDNGEAVIGQRMEVPDYGIYSEMDWESDQKGYAAMITRMDKDIGAIIQKLKDEGIDENTLVIFTSDNGPEMNYSFAVNFDSNGEFRGGKRDLYEGGIREPFIARWPEQISPGSVSEHISAFWDFLPTACEIAGVAVPVNTDGISYVPALTSKDNQLKHDYLYWEYYGKGGKKALRKEQWKAVVNDLYKDQNSLIELYDLKSDPGETSNLADQYPEIVSELDSIMQAASSPSSEYSFSK